MPKHLAKSQLRVQHHAAAVAATLGTLASCAASTAGGPCAPTQLRSSSHLAKCPSSRITLAAENGPTAAAKRVQHNGEGEGWTKGMHRKCEAEGRNERVSAKRS